METNRFGNQLLAFLPAARHRSASMPLPRFRQHTKARGITSPKTSKQKHHP
jgi:hypothetical protein